MASRQLNFYAADADLPALEAAVRGAASFWIMPDRTPHEGVPDPIRSFADARARPEGIVLVPSWVSLEGLHRERIAGSWRTNVFDSPIVELGTGSDGPEGLYPGRFYGVHDRVMGGVFVDKGPEFRDFLDRVISAARKVLRSRGRFYRFGKVAWEQYKSGRVMRTGTLVDLPPWSEASADSKQRRQAGNGATSA